VIVIDSSALIAILMNEPESDTFSKAIADSPQRMLNAVNYQESAQVMVSRLGEKGLADLDDYVVIAGIQIMPHNFELASYAVSAFRQFGKGMNPKSRLNMGDCAAYALATFLDAPLLFKGDDFTHTDVKPWR
jgi:ribonuclease VapC